MASKAKSTTAARRGSKKKGKAESPGAKRGAKRTGPKPDHLLDTQKSGRVLWILKDQIIYLIETTNNRTDIGLRSEGNKSIPDVEGSATSIFGRLGRSWQTHFMTITRQNRTGYVHKGEVESLWASNSDTEISIKGRSGSLVADEDVNVIYSRLVSP